jgi:hypothetical protein
MSRLCDSREKENIPVSSLLYKVYMSYKTSLVLHAGPDRCVTTLSYNYRRIKVVIPLLRVLLVPNIFTLVVALSDHDIRITSLSSADSFHVSWDRSLRLWMSLPSL